MILGILSDTHGRVAIAAEAIKLLRAQGAAFFIHCGDVGDGVLEQLPAGVSAFVFGNNDYDHASLIAEAAALDVRCLANGGVVELDGKSVAVTHGDERDMLDALLLPGTHDYLLTGHTHVPHDRQVGRTRRINPGALHRAARKTVATLDLATNVLAFHLVPGA